MDAEKQQQVDEIFNDIDMDHSGDWNTLEIRIAALRVSGGPTDQANINQFYSDLTNCTGKNLTMANLAEVEDHRRSFRLQRESVLTCDPVIQQLLKSAAKQKRFKFRIGDSEVSL